MTLNEVTPEMLVELRRLAREVGDPRAALWLASRVGSYAFVAEFLRDVVHGGMDPAVWGHRDALVVPLARGAMGSAEVMALLDGLRGERWWRIGADGAPGVMVRGVSYRWRSGLPQTMAICVAGALVGQPAGPLQRVDDLEDAVRRWNRARGVGR